MTVNRFIMFNYLCKKEFLMSNRQNVTTNGDKLEKVIKKKMLILT